MSLYYVPAPVENTDGDGNYNNNDGNDHYVVGGEDTTGGDNISITGDGNNTVNGGGGDDIINIDGDGNNSIVGGDGSDVIIVDGGGNNTIYGGNDSNGGGKDDSNNIKVLGEGYYVIYGGNGADEIDGSEARKTAIFGLGGDDKIYTGQEENYTDGGAGNDTIYAQGEENLIYGGYGADEITLERASDASGTIYGGDFPGEGEDYTGADSGSNEIKAEVKGDVEVHAGNNGDNITVGYSTFDQDIQEYVSYGKNTVYGGSGDDEILAKDSDEVTIYAGAGADQVEGTFKGNSYIEAGEGDDGIVIYGGNNYVDGGAGKDLIYSANDFQNRYAVSSTASTIIGGTGDDDLRFSGEYAARYICFQKR